MSKQSLVFRLPKTLDEIVAVSLLVIGLIVVVNQLTAPVIDVSNQPKQDEPCKGIPLQVDYPYQGGMLEPHACREQCGDQVWRHIVYTNGVATQCQQPPGCNDWGEDSGITCKPNLDEEEGS